MTGERRVTLWSVFREDRRHSMDLYAEQLRAALGVLGWDATVYTPRLPAWAGSGLWGTRFARYVDYSWHARRANSGVHHVVDPGYGHLLYSIDSPRTVVTVHDVMPILRWRGRIPGVPPARRPWLNLLSAKGVRRAARVIAISENTRRDLIELRVCDPAKITVIHHGIETMYRVLSCAERERARQKWRLPADGTLRVLVVGSAYYKNQPVALRAFAKLRATLGAKLELVGIGVASEIFTDTVRRLGLASCVREFDHVAPDEMVELYNCVDILLFPSLYEGFGRPPLEAMACGVPVVTSNAAALLEAVGDAALVCDPQDEDAFASQMQKVLSDPVLRKRLLEAGFLQCRRFSWEEAARRTAEVYGELP